MHSKRICVTMLALVMSALLCRAGGRWGYPVGISYVSGIQNVIDFYEEQYPFLDEDWFVPVGLSFTPYYEADSDLVDSSSPGAFGAVGVEFLRHRMIGVSLEVGYDGSEVTMMGDRGEEDIKTGEALVSLRAVF